MQEALNRLMISFLFSSESTSIGNFDRFLHRMINDSTKTTGPGGLKHRAHRPVWREMKNSNCNPIDPYSQELGFWT
jgi:hypothetical protein